MRSKKDTAVRTMRRMLWCLTAVVALCGRVGLDAQGDGGYRVVPNAPVWAQAQAPAGKVDIVRVAGCLRERGAGNWMLVRATDPVSSSANAPAKNEIPTAHVNGANEFRLIGVSEFELPGFRDQTVVVKGLFIKAAPVSRLNVTSVVTAVPNCPPGAPK